MAGISVSRYSRHLLLDEIGVAGQARIAAARVLIVGVGGLGSPAALYLAASGVGQLTLADGDTVDLSNLQRQVLHTHTRIGQPKALSGQTTLAQINPEVVVDTITEHLRGQMLEDAVARLGEVAEGVNTLKVLKAKAQELNVYMPLVAGLHAILFEGRTLNQVIELLMRAEPKTDVDFISNSGFN